MNGWRAIAAAAIGASIALACSGAVSDPAPAPAPSAPPTATTPSSPDPPSTPAARSEREVARAEIGPAGGVVEGGEARLEIPAGALDETKTFVIGVLNPSQVSLPSSAALVGSVYALAPDDVTFAKAVTISVAVNPQKRPAVGSIALMRAPSATSAWVSVGAAPVYAPFVSAETNHLSDWAAVASSESIDGGPCDVVGFCFYRSGGSTQDSGAVTTTTTCQTTNTTNELSCESISGSGSWTCGCAGTAAFPLAQDASPTSDQLAELWSTKCVGTCIPRRPPPMFDSGPPQDASTD